MSSDETPDRSRLPRDTDGRLREVEQGLRVQKERLDGVAKRAHELAEKLAPVQFLAPLAERVKMLEDDNRECHDDRLQIANTHARIRESLEVSKKAQDEAAAKFEEVRTSLLKQRVLEEAATLRDERQRRMRDFLLGLAGVTFAGLEVLNIYLHHAAK